MPWETVVVLGVTYGMMKIKSISTTKRNEERPGKVAQLAVMDTNVPTKESTVAQNRSEVDTHSILASLSLNIAVIDGDGEIVATNPAWDGFASRNAGVPERTGVGSNYIKVCQMALGTSEDSEVSRQVVDGLRKVLVGQCEEFCIEYPCHSPTKQRWFLMQATPLKQGMSGAVVSHQDITDRVLSEQRLKENKKLLQLVMDTVPHYIYAKNKEGVFVFVNQYTAVRNGFSSPSEMVGQRDLKFVSELEHAQLLGQIDLQVIETGVPVLSIEEKITDCQGNTQVVQTSKLQFLQPVINEPAVLCVSVDITERKLAEEKVRENEERLRAILGTASDAIITIDQRGMIESVNQATEDLFGYTRAELVGANVSILMPLPFRRDHDSYIQRYVATGDAHIIGIGREVICRREDGSTFPAELSVSEVDHLGLFTGILRDVSARKEMQKHILEIASDEQRRIGLELHDGTQQELTGLSLYANTLQEAIHGASEIVSDGNSGWQFTTLNYLRLKNIAALLSKRIAETNKNVRDLAHGIMPVLIHTEGLRSALIELTSSVNSNESIRCDFECEGEVTISNNTTATHLYRIAQEAVNNALRHGYADHIRIHLTLQGDRIALEIRDNGVGINNDALDGKLVSKGLGMRTMEYRASMIGGRLEVQRVPEGGTLIRCEILRGGNM